MLKMISKTIENLINTTTQEKILSLIKKQPNITQKELAIQIGMTRDGIAYHTKSLKENGVIERIGFTKKGTWKIKK